jgi:hypothetical protein
MKPKRNVIVEAIVKFDMTTDLDTEKIIRIFEKRLNFAGAVNAEMKMTDSIPDGIFIDTAEVLNVELIEDAII